jgi:hypothetical protein
MRISVDGSGRPMVPVNSVMSQRFAVPLVGHRLLHRHAAARAHHQAGKVDAGEVRLVQQAVVQRVHGREHVDAVLLQFLDEAGHVARIGNQQIHAAHAHAQQGAHGQCVDVIQRQRAGELRRRAGGQPGQRRAEPGFVLQHVGDHVLVVQYRPLRDAGGAAGVLQERDIVMAARDGLQGQARAVGQHALEWRGAGQRIRRHQLFHRAHDEVDDQALGAQQVAHAGRRRAPDLEARRVRP